MGRGASNIDPAGKAVVTGAYTPAAGCIWPIKSVEKFAKKRWIQGAEPQEYLMYSKVSQRSRQHFLVELSSTGDWSDVPQGRPGVCVQLRRASLFFLCPYRCTFAGRRR